MVDVFEELAGRELNDIVESRGLRDDETAVNQLCEAWLVYVAKITFDKTSSITNVLIFGLTYETHFEEGSRKCIIHRLVVNWKSIRSEDHQYLMHEKNDYYSRAKDCQVHAVRGSRANCQRYQNDEYRNYTSSNNLEIGLQAECAFNS